MSRATGKDLQSLAARLSAALRRWLRPSNGASSAAWQIHAVRYRTAVDLVAVILLIVTVSLVNLAFGRHGWLGSVLGASDRWTLGGVLPGFIALVLGLGWFAWRRAAYTLAQLKAREHAEQEERIISAIGLGAGWDLDLDHVYARFANDLRSLVEYDRLTITMSRPDRRTEVVFAHGVKADGVRVGGLIPPDSAEPDGLEHPEAQGFHSCAVAPFRGPVQLSGHMILAAAPKEPTGRGRPAS